MRMAACSISICLSLLACAGLNPASAGTVHLDADFDTKTIDAPIGAGGAALGEPTYVEPAGCAYVRSSPMPTPSLEIQDIGDDWEHAWFSFINGAKITSGTVVVMFKLWIAEGASTVGGDHRLEIRQVNPDRFSFVQISFMSDGRILLLDNDTLAATLGQYETGRAIPIAIALDLDVGSYDVWIDSQLVRDDEPVALSGQGVDRLLFATTPDTDLTGRFYIDDLYVTDDPNIVPVRPCSWGTIRALFAE